MTRTEIIVTRLEEKAQKHCKEAIGLPFTIKQRNSNRSFKGTIVTCTAAICQDGYTLRAFYQVTLEGATGQRECYTVTAIPRRRF